MLPMRPTWSMAPGCLPRDRAEEAEGIFRQVAHWMFWHRGTVLAVARRLRRSSGVAAVSGHGAICGMRFERAPQAFRVYLYVCSARSERGGTNDNGNDRRRSRTDSGLCGIAERYPRCAQRATRPDECISVRGVRFSARHGDHRAGGDNEIVRDVRLSDPCG